MDRINDFPHKRQANERNHNQHQPLDVNEKTPVNQIVMPYDQIKAYDMDTNLTLELKRENETATDVNDIAFFILANSKDEYTNVENYSVDDGVVNFTMPKVDTDKYYPQIMDKQGRVYSSNDNQFIDVVYNRESRVNELFPMIKHEVIEKVTPSVKQFVMDNKEQFSIKGDKGVKGDKGDKGDPGPKGNKGNRGEKGDKGDKGEQGEQGPQGERGFRGNRGPEGPQGPIGPQGPKGEDGTVEFDLLTPEQQQSLVGPEGPIGPQGPQGEQGPKGVDGDVEFTELTEEQIEMIRGPRGANGMQGPDGPEGPQGPQGEEGPQGPKGVDGTVEFNELTEEQIEMLRGPKGEVTSEQLNDEIETLNTLINQYGINVKTFGARGDGSTDDTESIQSAIDYANENKINKVFIPPGEYMVSTTITTAGCSIEGLRANVYGGSGNGVVLNAITKDFIVLTQGSTASSNIEFNLKNITVYNASVGYEFPYVINSLFENLHAVDCLTGFVLGKPTSVGSMFNNFNNLYTRGCDYGVEVDSSEYFNNNTFNNGYIQGNIYAMSLKVTGGYGAVNNTFNNVEFRSALGRGVILTTNENTVFNGCYFEVGGNAIHHTNFCNTVLNNCVYALFKADNTNSDTAVVYSVGGSRFTINGGSIIITKEYSDMLFFNSGNSATHLNVTQIRQPSSVNSNLATNFNRYSSPVNMAVYELKQ